MRNASEVGSDYFHYISSKREKTELLAEILKNELEIPQIVSETRVLRADDDTACTCL